MKLLRIDSSARGTSVTRKLTAAFTDAWKTQHPGGSVIERDTCSSSLPLITDEWSATYSDPSTLSVAQREYLSVSDSLITELSDADTILIGAPMYNLSVSAPLKAWIDQVVPGRKNLCLWSDRPQRAVGWEEDSSSHGPRRIVHAGLCSP